MPHIFQVANTHIHTTVHQVVDLIDFPEQLTEDGRPYTPTQMIAEFVAGPEHWRTDRITVLGWRESSVGSGKLARQYRGPDAPEWISQIVATVSPRELVQPALTAATGGQVLVPEPEKPQVVVETPTPAPRGFARLFRRTS